MQQLRTTRTINDEIDQVKSLLESMTLEAGKQPPTISSLQTKENLELELELTQAKIELARLQSDMTRVTRSKMAATNLAHVNTQN